MLYSSFNLYPLVTKLSTGPAVSWSGERAAGLYWTGFNILIRQQSIGKMSHVKIFLFASMQSKHYFLLLKMTSYVLQNKVCVLFGDCVINMLHG